VHLTTTSYAILGQLVPRPATTYELAKRMQRNLHYFWPRAESRIYDEAKRLVRGGLARAEKSYTGKRARTIYSITPAGREALAEWLAGPAPRWFALETEGLLRLFVGNLGSRDDLVAAVEGMRSEAEEMLRIGKVVAKDYLAGDSEFQEQVHIRALVFDFLAEFGLGMLAWAERSLSELEGWDDLSPDGKAERALELMASQIARYPV
jgi:PadR family transcriptional regulator, regulatory protein AphA